MVGWVGEVDCQNNQLNFGGGEKKIDGILETAYRDIIIHQRDNMSRITHTTVLFMHRLTVYIKSLHHCMKIKYYSSGR